MFISSHHRRFTSKAVRLSSLLVSSPRRSLYALTYAQPPTSPIDTSRASAKGLASIPSTSFHLHVNFLSLIEQEQLLRAALKRLDEIRGVSRALKQRRKALQTPVARPHSWSSGHPLLDCFYPEDCYDFSEAHFDSVIHNYRESHVSNWPEDVKPILTKVAKLMPPGDLELSTVQCHALHLAPSGVILPHIDNIEASGGTILGISLGASRVLKLEPKHAAPDTDSIDVRLDSGSVYMQTDVVRYDFKHSIPTDTTFRGEQLAGGHRLSIMMRDLHSLAAIVA